ncbi:MAG: hypothetical protein FWB71_02765, partial [Defluviitaleaceae bacterium]|nr:hypothetical protein [Defluviitaleaceae bacterium]
MKSTLSKKKNRIIIVLSISVLFLVVGVFLMSNRGSYEFRNNEMDFARFFDDPGLLYGETLTIAINEPTKTRMSLQALSQSFMRNHPGVNIEFVPLPTVAGRWSWQIHSEFLRDGLMTGNAPVLFCSAGGFLDTTDPRVNRFFADWLLLMQADPDFNEEKYFMNMLNFTIQQNSMPTWPLFAQHIFFAPNNSIPGLAEAVAELGGLSIEDLFYLHYVFADNNFFISPNFSPIFATNMSIDLFLDKESGMVNFSGSDFIDFIAQAASLTSPNMGQIPQLPPAIPIEPMRERMIWHEYLFINAPFYQFAAPTAEPLFGQPVPIVNNRREPILLGNGDLIINESASPAQQVL